MVLMINNIEIMCKLISIRLNYNLCIKPLIKIVFNLYFDKIVNIPYLENKFMLECD